LRVLIARTIIAGIFLLAAIYVAVANWACVIISVRNQRRGVDRHHSTVPIITVLLAALALLAWPFQPKLWILLIPILDMAHLNLLLSPFWFVLHVCRKRRQAGKDQN
jgi:hypothetical protein